MFLLVFQLKHFGKMMKNVCPYATDLFRLNSGAQTMLRSPLK